MRPSSFRTGPTRAVVFAIGAALPLWLAAVGPPSLAAQQVVDLPGQDVPLDADFEEVRRVGEPLALFTNIGAGAFADDGQLYVLDATGGGLVLLRIEEDGTAREVGGRGQGPGEFSALLHFAPIDGGRVAAFDMVHDAYLVFGSDGGFERAVKMAGSLPGGMSAYSNVARGAVSARDGDGLISQKTSSMDLSGIEEGRFGMVPPAVRVLERIELEGETAELDTVMRLWSPPPPEPTEENMEGMVLSFAIRLFEPETHFSVLGDGTLVVADSTAYAVKLAGRDGVVETVLRRPLSPVEVTRRIRDRAKEVALEAMGEMGPFPGRDIVEDVPAYHEISVIVDVKAGWEENIWVQRFHPDQPWNGFVSGPVDVLSRDGRYLGSFAAEANAMPLAFGPDGLVAYVETDDFDTPTLVIKRLPAELR